MAYLVGEDIGGGEVASGAELGRKLVEELEIEVNAVVERAVVGAHTGVGSATAGVGETCEQHQFGVLVLASRLGEDVGPESLVVVEDHRHEISPLRLGIGSGVERVGLAGTGRSRLELVEDVFQATAASTAKERK